MNKEQTTIQNGTNSDPVWKRFLKTWSGHFIFLALNFILVFANIIFPRYVDTPNIEIASVEVIVDEDEIRVPPSLAYVSTEVFQLYDEGDEIVSNKRCFNALEKKRIIPSSCVDVVVEAIDILTSFAEKERDRKLIALGAIDTYSKEELVEALTSSSFISYRSFLYNEIFFNFLAVDEIAKDEIAPSIKNALLSAAVGLVKREFGYVVHLETLKALILRETKSDDRSGEVAFRIIALNSGYKGGVIFPSAQLTIAGENIFLVQDTLELLADPNQNSDSKHELLEAGEVVSLYFVVDQKKNTANGNVLLEKIVKQGTPLPFNLEIDTTNGPVSSSGSLSVETISFELTFGK